MSTIGNTVPASSPPVPGSNLGSRGGGPPHSLVWWAADHTVILYFSSPWPWADPGRDNQTAECRSSAEDEDGPVKLYSYVEVRQQHSIASLLPMDQLIDPKIVQAVNKTVLRG